MGWLAQLWRGWEAGCTNRLKGLPSSSGSNWKLVTSGFPQESVLWPVFIDVFFTELGVGLSMSSVSWWGASLAVQSSFDVLEEWDNRDLMLFSKPYHLLWILTCVASAVCHCSCKLLCYRLSQTLARGSGWLWTSWSTCLVAKQWRTSEGMKDQRCYHSSVALCCSKTVLKWLSGTYAETMSLPKAARGKNQNSWEARSSEELIGKLETGPRSSIFLYVFLC